MEPERCGRKRLSDRFGGLADVVARAIDSANLAPDLTGRAIEGSAHAITDALGKLTHVPDSGEVTRIVQGALETAGQGAGAAAEAAGDIAGDIMDGIGDIDLNIG